MFRKVPFVILVILAALSESARHLKKELSEKRSQIETRLNGGSYAEEGAYPFMVYIYLYNDWSYCGGALLDHRWVLTSAECTACWDTVEITLGTNDFEVPDPEAVELTSSTIIAHPDWNENDTDFKNNIALLMLDHPVNFTKDIQPIALAADGTDPVKGDWVKMLGWDRNNDRMDELDVPLISDDDCRLMYSTKVYDGLMCASAVGGNGLCDGDMGSPLIYKVGNSENYTLHGIASFRTECVQEVYPSAFSRVTYFLDWIEKETGITP